MENIKTLIQNGLSHCLAIDCVGNLKRRSAISLLVPVLRIYHVNVEFKFINNYWSGLINNIIVGIELYVLFIAMNQCRFLFAAELRNSVSAILPDMAYSKYYGAKYNMAPNIIWRSLLWNSWLFKLTRLPQWCLFLSSNNNCCLRWLNVASIFDYISCHTLNITRTTQPVVM